MRSSTIKKKPELVYKEGKPVSVILDINNYEEMLERLEDFEDLRYIEEMKKKGPKFRDFDEFLLCRGRDESRPYKNRPINGATTTLR